MDRKFEGRSRRCGARGFALLLATIAALSACGRQTGRDSSSSPSFASPRSYATGPHPASVAIGDLNGDGKADLATANSDGHRSSVSVLFNMSDGSFEAKVDYAAGFGGTSVAIGDLKGDGGPDLATANWYADTVSVPANRGDGSFQAKLDYATGYGTGPVSVAIGDLNGDRKPDWRLRTSSRAPSPCSPTRPASAWCRTSGEGRCRPRSRRWRGRVAASGRSVAPTRRPSRGAA